MKKTIICIALLLIVFFLVGVFKYINDKSLNYKGAKEIVLNTNVGVPYEWECNVSNEKIAKIKKEYSVDKSGKNVAGGRVEIHYVIKGIKKGNTNINCKYINFVDNKASETKKYKITVNNKLKLNIQEK